MTKGLPGSGKSTWAKEVVLSDPKRITVRINKDDLRSMLHADRWKGTERRTVGARDALVKTFLQQRLTVIVDDTNLNPDHEQRLRALAMESVAEFEVKDFTHVDLHTCVRRDLKRERSVGEKVIRDMYEQYLAPKPQSSPPMDVDLPHAVLVDIDGTVARMTGRGPFEWDRVEEDEPHQDVIDLVNTMRDSGAEIVFVSGRDEICYARTRMWLARHLGQWAYTASLHMRPKNDMRKDAIVKGEIYEQKILGHYNVWFILDDRNQVVDMWRMRGLRTLQVAPGAF
jgi:tRNA uridine 5-carbamoylmethylation protein Kti12